MSIMMYSQMYHPWGCYGRHPRYPPLKQGHLVSDTLLVGSSELDEIPNYTGDQSNNHSDKLPPIMSWNQEFKYIHPDIANSQEPVLGRYYYPPTSHIVSPRAVLNTSDPLSSRFSSKSSYNLLPSKYTVMRNNNQYRGGGHDLVSPHVLLPGAYDNPYVSNAYSDSSVGTTGSWHSDLGSLSKINLKPKPLEPIQSLREKFFESARRNETLRSDSQQSGATEEESEPEHEKTESQPIKPAKPPLPKQRNQNVNQEARKPPIAPRPIVPSNNVHADNISKGNKRDGVNSQDDEVSVRRQTEMLIHSGVSREYHVYNARVEIDPAAARTPIAPLGSSLPSMVKRGDADSAGSNHTRDSGVSVGSVGGGSKTPPSVHNTPPTHHKSPSLSQRNSSAAQREQAAVHDARTQQLNRNWQSTPDVPLETNAERNSNLETLQRNRSGSSSRIKTQIPKPAQVSASEESMPVHRKPVLARRGQSVTRTSSNGEHEQSSLPRMTKYSGNSVRDHQGRKSLGRNGSGDHLDDEDEDGGHYVQNNNVVYSYQVDNSFSKSTSLSPPELRNSVSTGNLTRDTDVGAIRSRIPASKSTYFEVGEDEGPKTVRLSSRREGPFGDVRASIDDDFHQGATTLPSRRNPVSKATTGRMAPTKVYKGSFREMNSRKASNGSTRNEVFPSDLKPVTSPKHALPTALGQLESSDWETNVDGFRQMVRMVRFDPDAIRNDLHNINLSGIKHLSNLRSQVCRSAILFFEELFIHLGRSMEMDCEKIAEKLLDKSADTNKFIREASGRALEAMMINVTPLKGLTCLDLFGTRHRNPVVRCMASKLTAKLVSTVGPERCLGELSERLLPMLCKLLQEGSLETRTSAKTAMSMLMTQPSFHVLLRRHVPVDILRHAQKNIDALQKF